MGRKRQPTGNRLLDEANNRLESARVPVRILTRGGRLKLQATLPKKTGEGTGKKQRQIALNLPATADGYREAEAKAHQLGRSLLFRVFKWEDWEETESEGTTVREWVEKLREAHFSENKISGYTWERHWMRVYNQLPQDSELTAAAILAQVLITEPNSWTRRQTCLKLQRLADLAGVEVNLKKYQGNYGRGTQQAIAVPTDEEIARFIHGMKSAPWRWIAGMLATFGLRDHEVCFCHFEEDPDGQTVLQVEEGKTGPRLVYPFYPGWVEEFGLLEVVRPKLTFREDSKYRDAGDRIYKGLKRQGLAHHPYAYRHAYAIRESVVFGLPVAEAAANMGHDPSVHLSTYNRWINQSHRRQVFQSKKNAVQPPKVKPQDASESND